MFGNTNVNGRSSRRDFIMVPCDMDCLVDDVRVTGDEGDRSLFIDLTAEKVHEAGAHPTNKDYTVPSEGSKLTIRTKYMWSGKNRPAQEQVLAIAEFLGIPREHFAAPFQPGKGLNSPYDEKQVRAFFDSLMQRDPGTRRSPLMAYGPFKVRVFTLRNDSTDEKTGEVKVYFNPIVQRISGTICMLDAAGQAVPKKAAPVASTNTAVLEEDIPF